MNIGVNTRVLLKHRMEGVCRYIYETTRRMVADHPEHTFYLFFDRKYDESFVFGSNVVPVVIPPQARHPILWYLWFEHSLPYFLKKYKIDVLYSGDTYLSLKTKVPTLLISHDIAYHHYPEHLPKKVLRYYTKYFPLFHRRAEHIVAVSESTRRDIIDAYDLREDKVTVGYNACPDGFAPISEDKKQEIRNQYTDGKKFFIYVGSFHPRKNVANLIKAFEHFRATSETDHKLVLVGRMAWNNETLVKTYEESPYKKDIILPGPLYQEVRDLVPASEALVYVSVFEGFGIPILEGWSSGVPVITSNLSSMKEVASDAAYVVDPHDHTSISTAMADVCKADSRKNEYINRGMNRLKSFNWNTTSQHIHEQLMAMAH